MGEQDFVIRSATVVALAVGLALAFFPRQNNAQDATMKKDITIVLDENLAQSGGLVVLQIVEIEENPFETNGQTQRVTIDGPVSVINLPVLKGSEYVYRFETPSKPSATTNRFSVGSTILPDSDAATTLLYHHVETNPSWSLSYSRRVASVVQPAAAHQKYDCHAQQDILVCDASSVLEEPIPE